MKKTIQTKPKRSKASAPKAKRFLTGAVLVPALIGVVVAGLWLNHRTGAIRDNAQSSETKVTHPDPAALVREAQLRFQKLVGRWQRPDGGYVIEIKGVENNGTLDAAYLNPDPIHVAKAEASAIGSTVKVMVELNDVNYPGSTYTLAYDPTADQLKGIYYQAVERERYEIFFNRMR